MARGASTGEAAMGTEFGFHDGEREVQTRAGERSIADRNGSVLTDNVIAGARPFIAKQFMLPISSIDPEQNLWASVLFGKPGFLQTPDGSSIMIGVAADARDPNDPFWRNIEQAPQVGMLFIELATRRRYRVNGKVTANTADHLEVGIDEAYPNCPKYIQRRQMPSPLEYVATTLAAARGEHMNSDLGDIVRQADTIFVASAHAEHGLDMSHRGGKPGFISVLEDGTLRIPDYKGNSLFNTLGNITSNPRVGLAIPDFANNRLLHLSGTAQIQWDLDDPLGTTGGTRRFWDVKVLQWVLREIPHRLAWEFLDPSPYNFPIATA
jgi:predicted pyridoxine 5'-phosphate oxidase superfamily flavin-nucleotide-binding protein